MEWNQTEVLRGLGDSCHLGGYFPTFPPYPHVPSIHCPKSATLRALTVDLTGGESRWGQARRAVGGQRRAWAWPWWWPTVRVHGQLVPKGFLLAPIGKPVVDAHLCDKVGTQPLCL